MAFIMEDWYGISVTLAGISVICAAMLIILSRMFSLKNLEQAAKAEFIFSISTVLIVIFSVSLVAVGEQMLVGPSGVAKCTYLATFSCNCTSNIPDLNQRQTVIDYMDLYMKPPKDCTVLALDTIYIISIPVDAAASIFAEIYMSELATGFGVKALAERNKNSSQMLIFYLYFSYVLTYMLKFIKYFAGFFFGIGVALRALPPTRGAGAYFMAAAIGFYFIFPTAYILFATMSLPHTWASTSVSLGNYNSELATGVAPQCTGATMTDHFSELCQLPDFSDFTDLGCGVGDASWMDTAKTAIKANKKSIADMINPERSWVTDIVNRMLNTVCVIPLVAMVITMTFILNTTNLFGGNIPEIGRGLVKLI
ncbi:MAG: hypothetical protein V1492_02305 [Candidatus Micrarchaeota archaeon]